MLTQKQRLENFKANADQVEAEATSRHYTEARSLLRKGFCEKYVATRCYLPLKVVKELKEKII